MISRVSASPAKSSASCLSRAYWRAARVSRMFWCSWRITMVGPCVMPVACSKAGKRVLSSASKWALSASANFFSAAAASPQSPSEASSSARAKMPSQSRWSWVMSSEMVFIGVSSLAGVPNSPQGATKGIDASQGHPGMDLEMQQLGLQRIRHWLGCGEACRHNAGLFAGGREWRTRGGLAGRNWAGRAAGCGCSCRSRSAITCPTCCARSMR